MNMRILVLLLLINTTVFAQLHTYKWTNGKKKAEGVVKEGLEQGKWTFWSKDGVIQQEVTYKDGLFDGKYTSYNDQGKKREEGLFIRAKKEGVCKIWYANGQLEMIGYNKNGYQDSLWTFFYPTGNKKEEGNFKKDQRSGAWHSWYDNEQLKSVRIIKEGTMYLDSYYTTDGTQLIKAGNGSYESYSENGELQFKGVYKGGRRTGDWSEFDAQKNLVSRGEL